MNDKDVKVGDMIHIFAMYGEPEYKDREGIVEYIDDIGQIHGTWGGLALNQQDDWTVIR
jgi:hypothetical protein